MENLGYQYVSVWECEFHKQIADNPHLAHFVKNINIEERLKPRNGFMGGRTNAIK